MILKNYPVKQWPLMVVHQTLINAGLTITAGLVSTAGLTIITAGLVITVGLIANMILFYELSLKKPSEERYRVPLIG